MGATRWLCLLCGLIFFCQSIVSVAVYAETAPSNSIPFVWSVDRLTTDVGLSSNQIRRVFRAKSGYLWILTDRGLAKYDGYKFINYQNDPHNSNSLSGNELYSYLEDDDGILWIGGKEGLNRFDPETGIFTRYLHDPKKPASLWDHFITDIIKDRKGRYWIATNGGLNLFDPVRETFRAFTHDPNNPNSLGMTRINRIAEDAAGKIWIGPTGNCCIERYDPDTGTIQRYPNVLAPEQEYPDVMAMVADPSGDVFLGSWGLGLFRVNPNDGSFRNYQNHPGDPNSLPGNIVQCIEPDGTGGYWIGTRGGGLCRFDPQTERFQPVKVVWKSDPGVVFESITDIDRDNTGVLWLGTLNDGVCRFDSNREQFLTVANNSKDPNSLSKNRVFSLCASRDGTIWIGTEGGGLSQYDPQTGRIAAHYIHDPSDSASLAGNTVISLYEDPTGTLYVGCWGTELGAFSRFIPETKTFRRYPHEPSRPGGLNCVTARAIRGDYTGKIWIGTDGDGINVFNPVTDTFDHYKANTPTARGLTDLNVRCFWEDHTRTMWIGTENAGLWRYDRGHDLFVPYKDVSPNPNLLPTANVLTIYEDSKNNLWCGTATNLVRLSADRTTTASYSMSDGLADNIAKGILEDEAGFLWISMDNGKISRFNTSTGKTQNFDRSDGLQGSAFVSNCITKGLDGSFYFGGLNGVNCIWPNRITQNTHIPPIVLTAFDVMAKPHPFETFVASGKPVELDYRQNFLSFEFAALNFTHVHKNQYAYRLKPLETKWNDSGGRRYAQYSALKPGLYVFQAKGSNNDGIWNEDGVSLSIYIQPPFWQTWWFQILVGGSILAALVWGYLYRIYFLEKQRKYLELEVEKRTHELYEANRTLDLLSKQDGLTKLANRRCFDEQLDLEWRRAMRNRTPLSLLFSDVDFFKNYNDFYGHQAGDECLQKIAQIFVEQINRPGDLAARYGGEEFVIILTGADFVHAVQFADQLRMLVVQVAMPHRRSEAANVVTISIGVATIVPHADVSPHDLVQAADQAMYRAKQNGRNQIQSASLV